MFVQAMKGTIANLTTTVMRITRVITWPESFRTRSVIGTLLGTL